MVDIKGQVENWIDPTVKIFCRLRSPQRFLPGKKNLRFYFILYKSVDIVLDLENI